MVSYLLSTIEDNNGFPVLQRPLRQANLLPAQIKYFLDCLYTFSITPQMILGKLLNKSYEGMNEK